MNKEIEKYVCLYLLVYVVVLAVFGFFQYMAVCQGQSLACAFDMEGINKIITTTAYVLTPIVAIIGFLSWKGQHNKNIYSDIGKTYLKKYENAFYLMSNLKSYYEIYCNENEYIEKQKYIDFQEVEFKQVSYGYIQEVVIKDTATIIKEFDEILKSLFLIKDKMEEEELFQRTKKLRDELFYKILQYSSRQRRMYDTELSTIQFQRIEDIIEFINYSEELVNSNIQYFKSNLKKIIEA